MKLINKNKGNTYDDVPTLISKGCVIEGKIKMAKTIQIEGSLTGDVLNAETLIVGENGIIIGNVQTKELIIFGEINGDVSADSIEIKGSGKVSGKIKTQKLQVESGAVYNGTLEMIDQTLRTETTGFVKAINSPS